MKYILKLIFLNRYVTRFFNRIWYWEPSFDNILFGEEEIWSSDCYKYFNDKVERIDQYRSIHIRRYDKKTKKYEIQLSMHNWLAITHDGPILEVDRRTLHKILHRPLKVTRTMQLKMNN